MACVLPRGLTPPPARPPQPLGPRVQDNTSGRKAQNRTWPDLLKVRVAPQATVHPCFS